MFIDTGTNALRAQRYALRNDVQYASLQSIHYRVLRVQSTVLECRMNGTGVAQHKDRYLRSALQPRLFDGVCI